MVARTPGDTRLHAVVPASEERRRVRLALLDDDSSRVERMAAWIGRDDVAFELVVAAATWMDLVTSTAFPAQLVVMSLQHTEAISIEARIRTCRAAGAAVLVLTDDAGSGDRAMAAGAVGVLPPASRPAAVLEAARAVMEVGASAASVLWRPRPPAADLERPKLSPGELEALRLYAAGASTKDVALRMNVQFETAKTYLRRVRTKYAKIGRPAGKKAELIKRATEDGFLQ